MIKEISSPKVKDPIFIAAWPGMGEVAYRSALFLREVMGFKMFAKMDAESFFKPAAVSVEKGILNLPTLPAGIFYFVKGKGFPDMILFLGEAQPPLEHAEAFAYAIINFIRKYKVKKIFTFAAKPEPIDHKAEPKVWIAAVDKEILKEFEPFGLTVLEEGQISGLNGLLLGVGKRLGMQGACLLGEIPFYTVQIENPRVSATILKILDTYLKLDLNLSPLQERGKFIEAEIDKLLNYLKGEQPQEGSGPTPLSEEDIDKIKKDLATYTKLPQSAREKIEHLFKEALTDIATAAQLKDELDRWHVYKDYEDRFLDLFKKRNNKDEPH